MTEVAPGLHRIALMDGFVGAYALVDDGDVTLVDTGPPDSAPAILEAIAPLGDLRRIVVTHAHADHSGSAAALREATGAPIHLSRIDAELIASGRSSRGLRIRPGSESTIVLPPGVTAEMLAQPAPAEPFEADEELRAGAVIGAPDLEAIPAPGHCEGQMALLWRRGGGMLVAGDAAANFAAVDIAEVGEDFAVALDSARRLAELSFEVAVFGHGEPLKEAASASLREAFATA
jgi:glyoxylase-like metal-dependent hydrolase (beta-lactamase superfamily II)